MDKKKIDLIGTNTVEVIGEIDKLPEKPVVYCGYEPSGPFHLGHLVTVTKLIQLKELGFHVKILLADLHASLNQKGDDKFIKEQVALWEEYFKASGINAEFVTGSSFQTNPEYIKDVFILANKITLNRALRSMQQVAREIDNAKVSQIIYPLMQIVDMKYLGVNAVEAGIEQRKIHMLAVENLKEIGFPVPVFIHTPLINSLNGPGTKMSSSIPNSFISTIDSDEEIKKKINNAYCVAKEIKDSPILEIAKLIIFPRIEEFIVNRPEKFGGDLKFSSYEELEDAFSKDLHPQDLKSAVAKYLCEIIKPIREKYNKGR